MLGRRRHGGQAQGAGAATIDGARIPRQAGSQDDDSGGFRLSENSAVYPSTHPDHPGYQIYFSFQGGGEVTVATPEHPSTTSPVFWLLDLEPARWTRLVDPDGRPIPVEIRVAEGLGSARWL